MQYLHDWWSSAPDRTYAKNVPAVSGDPRSRILNKNVSKQHGVLPIARHVLLYRGINNDPVRREICYHGSAQKSKPKTFIQAWLHIKTPDQYLTLMGCLLNKLPLCACSWQHFFLITWTSFTDASGLIELGPSSWTGQESCSWSNTIYLSWICTTAGIHVRHSYSTSSTTFRIFSFY